MRQIIGVAALVFMFAGCAWTAGPQQATAPRFEPIKVASVSEAVYPFASPGFGTLVLRVTVDGSGKIENVTVIYGIPSLTEGAESAVREWKFKPATLDGKPMTTSMIAAFTYGTWPFGNAFGTVRPQEQEDDHKAGFFAPIKVIANAPAPYPFASLASGTVILQVMVDEAGAIKNINVLHGIPSLTEDAESAVRAWKFKPAVLDGKPVTTSMVASFAFRVPSWHR
ncbi:MAG: energy transducer TonB [Terriglobia bacterium]